MVEHIDFSVELSADTALVRCLTSGARSVAYELDRDDGYSARLAFGTGECLLTVPLDDLDELVSDLENWGYKVGLPSSLRAVS